LARANYWTARVFFEKSDIPNACTANANALSEAGADEIELRNQIQYQGQRCPSTATSVALAKSPTVDAIAPPQAAPATVPTTPTNAGSSADPVIRPVDTVPVKAASLGAKASVIDPPIPLKTSPTTAVSKASTTPLDGSKYSVQVAAYNHKPDAQKLASSLVKRGYQARVDGDTVPFRVRIGRYSTASDAEKALAKIKAKHMAGFVVRAPER
jgi:cell division protein FtsN